MQISAFFFSFTRTKTFRRYSVSFVEGGWRVKILTLSAGRSSCITRKRSNRWRRYKLETDIVLFRNNVRGISHFVHTKRPRENVLLSFWSQRYNCTSTIYPREAGKITKDLPFELEHLADVAYGEAWLVVVMVEKGRRSAIPSSLSAMNN